MFNAIVGAGAIIAGVGGASRYDSGSNQKMRLLAALAPQHWFPEKNVLFCFCDFWCFPATIYQNYEKLA
jgi:hypothetical protein